MSDNNNLVSENDSMMGSQNWLNQETMALKNEV